MIDWLNSFSFAAVARLVHPLVVLAVLAALQGGFGYTVGWRLRMNDKEPDTAGDEFSVLVGLSIIVIAAESVLLNVWWMLSGVTKADGLLVTYLADSAVLLAALLAGSFLPHKKG